MTNNIQDGGPNSLSKIDEIIEDQLYHAQMGLAEDTEGGGPGEVGGGRIANTYGSSANNGPIEDTSQQKTSSTTSSWYLFAEDEQMKMYSRELEIDGLVCDPLKAVHVIKGVTGYEMCHRFFNPSVRFEWEETLESMKVVDVIDANTLVFHQIHKRIWPAAQRDAVFWSHIREVKSPKASCLSKDDISPLNRPDIKLLDVWIVCNNSTDKPDIPVGSCVRIQLTVSLVCETYIPANSTPETVKREDLICKIIYSSTINPGGLAPATLLRAVYRREYPRFLTTFSNYVITSTKSKPIAFRDK